MLGFVFRPLPNLRLHSFIHDPSYASLIEDEAAAPDIPEEAEPPLIWELKWRCSPTPKLKKEDEAVQKALEDGTEPRTEKEDN
jgi:hypothetical protein